MGAARQDAKAAVMPVPAYPLAAHSVWTPNVVKVRLRQAARVIACLPTGIRRRVTERVDVVRNAAEAYGHNAPEVARVMPSSQEISAADEAIGWLLSLDVRDRALVWARACEVKWRNLERRFGCSERHLRRHHTLAIVRIVARLNGRPLPGPKAVAGMSGL